jgi:acetyl-CoA carboxylase biotin carboxyl carrier protein
MAKPTTVETKNGTPQATARIKRSSVKPPKAIDTKLVRELAELLGETGVAEIEVKRGDLRIRVSRFAAQPAQQIAAYAAPPAAAAPAAPEAKARPEKVAPAAADDSAGTLRSPMVGTAYLKPSPEAKPFVEVGSEVKAGDKVLLIEAMKTFNDIVAHRSGRVSAILVDNAQPVEFGQPMLVIE